MINKSIVQIGFIGAGGIAERHLGVLQLMQDVRIVAFADPDFSRATALAGRVGAKAYNSHHDMLYREKLDAVYICVPPFAHGPPEDAVIAAGLPFFVEKPLSLDLTTGETIASKVQRHGLVTASGYHWRYLDTVEEARGLLARQPRAAGHRLLAGPDAAASMVVEGRMARADRSSNRRPISSIWRGISLVKSAEVYAQAWHPARDRFS